MVEKKYTESILTLSNRKNMTLSGVEKVVAVNENQIALNVSGNSMLILGSELSIEKLDVDNGNLKIAGIITQIKYNEKKENFIKRIFK